MKFKRAIPLILFVFFGLVAFQFWHKVIYPTKPEVVLQRGEDIYLDIAGTFIIQNKDTLKQLVLLWNSAEPDSWIDINCSITVDNYNDDAVNASHNLMPLLQQLKPIEDIPVALHVDQDSFQFGIGFETYLDVRVIYSEGTGDITTSLPHRHYNLGDNWHLYLRYVLRG